MAMLFLVRGLPGSGKSALALNLIASAVLAADYFFTDEGGYYEFNPARLPAAHADCQARCAGHLANGHSVAVANTFSCRWELEPYLVMAARGGHDVCVVDLFDGGLTDEALVTRCLHGVPVTGIAAMRARWEHDWRVGDPRAPWARP